MAESSAAQGRKTPIREYTDRIREKVKQLTEDKHSSLRCTKSREYKEMLPGLKQEIDDLKEDNVKQNRIIRETVSETKLLRQNVDLLSRSFANQQSEHKKDEEKISHLEAIVSASNDSSVSQMEDMKATLMNVEKEITGSNQGVRADIANMKHDADQKMNTLISAINAVHENQQKQQLQTQRFASTSTLDTVDTGFGELTIFEETEDEDSQPQSQAQSQAQAQAQPQPQPQQKDDKEAQVKKRINKLALQFETRIHYLVKPLARHLGLDVQCIKVICQKQIHGKDYRNQLFDVIDAWFQQCTREHKAITMGEFLRALQSAGFRFRGMDFEVKQMSHIDQVIIEKNFPYLAKTMMVGVTLTELRRCGLLNPDLINYILEMDSEMERVIRLVEILPILGDRALPSLLEALRTSAQTHIADVIEQSYPNRFYQLPLIQSRTKPVTEAAPRNKQDDTVVKQRRQGPIKETTL